MVLKNKYFEWAVFPFFLVLVKKRFVTIRIIFLFVREHYKRFIPIFWYFGGSLTLCFIVTILCNVR